MLDGKAIGIITSGGDCGGLNAVIKGAASMALAYGITPYVILNGYAGLYNLHESENILELNKDRLDKISSLKAGSQAGNTRVKISKINDEDKYKKIIEGLNKFNIGALVISGGDDTGSVVVDLDSNGISCVHVPKTMDLDLHSYSVGGDSAVNRIAQYVEELKTTGNSHNRIMAIEVFGRYAGHTAFRGGIAADADCILIPEVPVDFDVIYEDLKKNFMRRVRSSEYKSGTYTIVAAEGITDETGDIITDGSVKKDAFGHKKLSGIGKYIRQQLTERIDSDESLKDFMQEQGLFIRDMNEVPVVREMVLTYLVRSGSTSALDANFGNETGAGAVILLNNGVSGVTVTGVERGKVQYIPTSTAIKQRHVSQEMVAFHEKTGVCFGRKPVEYRPEHEKLERAGWSYFE
jgi:6-phosphofructokinase